MPSLIPSIYKDVPDTLTDLYVNNTGGNALVKSVLIEHKNTPSRVIEGTPATPMRNFVSGHVSMYDGANDAYVLQAVNLDGNNKILMLGNYNFEGYNVTTQSYGWLQVLEYDSTAGAYYSYPVTNTAFQLSSGSGAKAGHILLLSPTKFVVYYNSYIESFKINADNTIESLGTANAPDTFNVAYSGLLSAYDTGTQAIHTTKALMWYHAGSGNIALRVLTIPDAAIPQIAGSSTNIVYSGGAGVTGATSVRATLKDNKYCIAASHSSTNTINVVNYSYNPSTDVITTLTSQTSVSVSNYPLWMRAVSFSGGTLGGTAGDGTEFNAHIVMGNNTTNYISCNSQTNATAVNTGVSTLATNRTAWSSANQGVAHRWNVNHSYIPANYGVMGFARNGASGITFVDNFYNGNNCGAYILPFYSKPVYRYGSTHYLTALPAMTDTSSFPVAASGAVYVPMGTPLSKLMKWHEGFGCWLTVQGSYIFALDKNGVMISALSIDGNFDYTAFDITPSGNVYLCGLYGSYDKASMGNAAYTHGVTLSLGSTGTTLTLVSTVAGVTQCHSSYGRYPVDVLAISDARVNVFYLYMDGSNYYWYAGVWSGTPTANSWNNGSTTNIQYGSSPWYGAFKFTGAIKQGGTAYWFAAPRLDTSGTMGASNNGSGLGSTAMNQMSTNRGFQVATASTSKFAILNVPGWFCYMYKKSTDSTVTSLTVPSEGRGFAAITNSAASMLAYGAHPGYNGTTSQTFVMKPDGSLTTFTDTTKASNPVVNAAYGNDSTLYINVSGTPGTNKTYEAYGAVDTSASFYMNDGTNSIKLGAPTTVKVGDVMRSADPVVIPNGGKLQVKLGAGQKYQLDIMTTVLTGV